MCLARLAWTLVAVLATGCTVEAVPVELRHFPLDSLDGIITRDGIELDTAVSSDGEGSLRIRADAPRAIHLFETGDVDVDAARLTYEAQLRTEDFDGQVYLEMWCAFGDRGEFFSRALHSPLSGTNGWTHQETPFVLQPGENPTNVKLDLVLDGSGTVWIDEVRLRRGPLPDL